MLRKIGSMIDGDNLVSDVLGAASICVTFFGLLCLPGLF